MNWFAFSRFSFARAAVFAAAIPLGCAWQQASAAEGPFANFPGTWDGSGNIHIGLKTERIRCKANYTLHDATGTYVVIQITCASDSYKFDLGGNFQADPSNGIRGNWSENSRGVAGSATGMAKGDRFQLHFESTAITGNMIMITRSSSQTVTIDTIGTKDKISASISLHRNSR